MAENSYDAPERMSEHQGSLAEVLEKALDNVRPMVEVKIQACGWATHQVPVEGASSRRNTLAMRWLIDALRKTQRKIDGASSGGESCP